MTIQKETRGQAAVLTVLFLAGLLGMGALVLDVGSWFRADRATQATADAAALAGAQALPFDPGGASGLAVQYANSNGGGLAAGDVSVSSALQANDTISVSVKRPAPGFLSKLFGIASVNVGSTATARIDGIKAARYVVPIVVKNTHPLLAGAGCPCFKRPTTLPLGKTGAPGAFDLVNLDGSSGGTGPPILAGWILHGFDGYLPLGGYFSDAGAKWNSSQVQGALAGRLGTDLLFPVYDTLTGSGSNATYHVIAWVGFHLTGFTARGSSGTISGYFTEIIWEGIQSEKPGDAGPDFGARTIRLVN